MEWGAVHSGGLIASIMPTSEASTDSNISKRQAMTLEKTCRNCMERFLPEDNHEKACKFHPESFTGETAQRWMAPGDSKGAAEVLSFWSCCGSDDPKAVGCCYNRHIGFGEPDQVEMRRPGMGVEPSS